MVVGNSTWEVMNAKKALRVEWEPFSDHTVVVGGRRGKETVTIPAGLESTAGHLEKMAEWAAKPGNVRRRDGDPESAFKNAATVIERTYTAPFLAHNCMEPMTFFADVTADKAVVAGPIQAPEVIEGTLPARLGMPRENIEIELLRMGGGFGRRAYGHYIVEAALISQRVKAPVRLMYTREDDMTFNNGVPEKKNFDSYRMIRMREAPKAIDVHFVQNGIDPTGMGEPPFPPIFGAVANALYKATGKRSYHQPFLGEQPVVG